MLGALLILESLLTFETRHRNPKPHGLVVGDDFRNSRTNSVPSDLLESMSDCLQRRGILEIGIGAGIIGEAERNALLYGADLDISRLVDFHLPQVGI